MRRTLLPFAIALCVLSGGLFIGWQALFTLAAAQVVAHGDRADLAARERADLAPGEYTGGKPAKNTDKAADEAETRRLVKLAKQKPSDDPFGQPFGADAPRGDAPAGNAPANADPADPFAPRDLKPFVNEDAFKPDRDRKPPVIKIDMSEKATADPAADAEKKIAAALEKRDDFDIHELPLKDVAEYMTEKYDIEIELHHSALHDQTITTELPITLKAKNISLRAALRLMLRSAQLTFMIHDEVLLITSQAQADQRFVMRGYKVADLLVPWAAQAEDGHSVPRDADGFVEMVEKVVAPTTWDAVGGPGSIDIFQDTLLVSQTMEVQGEVEGLVAAARKVQLAQRKTLGGKSVLTSNDSLNDEAAERINRILNLRVELNFEETPLNDAVKALSEKAGFTIVLDDKAFADAAVALDSPITFSSKRISLGAALRAILRPYQLTWHVRDEVMMITPQVEAAQRLVTRLYPVGDLLQSISDEPKARLAAIEKLKTTCTSLVAPTTWEQSGGTASLEFWDPGMALVCWQTSEIHEQLDKLFARLRQDLPEPKTAAEIAAAENEFVLRVYYLDGGHIGINPSGGPLSSIIPVVGEHPPVHETHNILAQIGKSPAPSPNTPAAKDFAAHNELILNIIKATKGEHAKPEPKQITLEDLEVLIRELVEPASWHKDKQAYLRAASDRLVVRQTPSVHRKINAFLGEIGVYGYLNLRTGEYGNPPGWIPSGGFGGGQFNVNEIAQ